MIAGITFASVLGFGIGALIGFTLHEWAHARTALQLGDTSQYFSRAPETVLFGGRLRLGGKGRLSLDPRAHLDPFGYVLATLVGFGWAIPVPVNTRAFYPHERRGLLIVSLAGPVMNLAIAFLFGLLFQLAVLAGLNTTSFFSNVWEFIILFNINLFFFNLLPLWPLDGWKIMLGLLPIEQSISIARYERESNFILIMLLLLGMIAPPFNLIGLILRPLIKAVFEIVTGLSVL